MGFLVASVTLGIGDVFTQLDGYLTLGAYAVVAALLGGIAVRTFGLGVAVRSDSALTMRC
jgi:hypothetical protein